jgi:hypothetical protein
MRETFAMLMWSVGSEMLGLRDQGAVRSEDY